MSPVLLTVTPVKLPIVVPAESILPALVTLRRSLAKMAAPAPPVITPPTLLVTLLVPVPLP